MNRPSDAKKENKGSAQLQKRLIRSVVTVLVAMVTGAGVGQYVPGVQGARSLVWPLAGSLAGLLVVGTYWLTHTLERRVGRATGYAGVLVTLSLAATLYGLTPAGCGPCSAEELQSWTATGFATGLAVVTLTLMAATTASTVRGVRRLWARFRLAARKDAALSEKVQGAESRRKPSRQTIRPGDTRKHNN